MKKASSTRRTGKDLGGSGGTDRSNIVTLNADEKEKWISAKVAALIKEGKKQDQAVAIANSMWDDDHANDDEEELAEGGQTSGFSIGDVATNPLAKTPDIQLKDIPLLRVGPTRNIDPDTGRPITITQAQYDEVLHSYKPDELHRAPIVREANPHKETNRDPVGWIDSVYEKPVTYRSGRTVKWIYGKPSPVNPKDPKSVMALKHLLENEMPHNSPELAPGEIIPAFVDYYERTKHWPKGSDGYYLKAVTALGTVAPAQFGQAGALLSDAEGSYRTLSLADSQEDEVAKEKVKCSECEHMADTTDTKCPKCGAKLGKALAAGTEGSPEEEKMETKEEKKQEEKDMAITSAPSGSIRGRMAMSEHDPREMELAEVRAEAASLKAKTAALEVQLAEDRKERAAERFKSVTEKVDAELTGYIESGIIEASEFPGFRQLMIEDEISGRTVKLADGKETHLTKVLRAHFAKQKPVIMPGQLRVITNEGVIELAEDMNVYREELARLNKENPEGAQGNVKKAVDFAEKKLGHKLVSYAK